jgi:hypothetical protein
VEFDDGRVGLPSRALSTGDKFGPWPAGQGGQAGPIDLPARLDPVQPSAPPRTPSARGGVGTHEPTPGVSEWHGITFGPGHPAMDYDRDQATPHAVFALHYVRRFVSTTAAVLARMNVDKPATTSGTLNDVSDEGAPASPIPAFRRFLVETLAEPFGYGRIWSDYLPPPDVQKPVQVRRMLSQQRLPRMGDPYQPRLTRLATTPMPSAPADAVLPVLPSGNTGQLNPYAGA